MNRALDKTLVLDSLNLFSTLKLVRLFKHIDFVELLDDPQIGHFLFKSILRVFKIKVEILDFAVSNIKSPNGESIWISSLKDSTPLAYSGSNTVVKELDDIERLTNSSVVEALRLASAKFLDAELRPIIKRILVANAIKRDGAINMLLKKPTVTADLIVYAENLNINLKFYRQHSSVCFIFLRQIYQTFGKLFVYRLKSLGKKAEGDFMPADIISFTDDPITLDFSYRTQLHWLESVLEKQKIRTCLLIRGEQNIFSACEQTKLKALNVDALALDSIHCSTFSKVQTPGVLLLEKALSAIFWKWFSRPTNYNLNHTMHLLSFIWFAVRLAKFCTKLKIKVYVFSESYNIYSYSMALACRVCGIQSIAYQYSLLFRPSLPMMSLADCQLVFSEGAKKSLSFGTIKPREFIVASYLYKNNLRKVDQRASLQRKVLKEQGVDLIIGYFDENINRLKDRWNVLGFEYHKKEITALASLVLKFPNVAIVLKPQFLVNSSKILYESDEVINSAFATGRFIEMVHGTGPRNVVFAGEAGQICDICIGNKIGATACLESVLQGCRALLINPLNMKGIWDCYFDRENITFGNLHEAIYAIFEWHNNSRNSDLGDWSSFLSDISTGNKSTLESVIISKVLKNVYQSNRG
ncbi:hypothetical protein OAW66_01495 [Alphaproteobacteria bacterium]|nr:hypothetical protein [Alphaproteobacteria bacterium]